MASVGFAGSDLEQTASEGSVLWLDRVYINKSPFNADGQCSFTISSEGKTRAECSALLSDGRKLKAAFSSISEWRSVSGDLRLPVQDDSVDCEAFLRMHGFASRAQFQCNFSRYSNEILAKAQKCNSVLSEDRVKENLMGGMKRFDEEVEALGQEAACAKVLESLPMVVAK